VNGRAVGAGLTGASSLVPVAPDGRFISAPDTAVLTGGFPAPGSRAPGKLATLLPDHPVSPGDVRLPPDRPHRQSCSASSIASDSSRASATGAGWVTIARWLVMRSTTGQPRALASAASSA
jgi:hypothetical protein